MTWLTTWPTKPNGRPAYAEHDTEQAAALHAEQIVRAGEAVTATYFETPEETL